MEEEKKIPYNNENRTTKGKRIDNIQRELRESPELTAYNNQRKKEFQGILDRVEVFTSASQLPSMRYLVHFSVLDDWWQKKGIYYADQINISEAATGKVIAWSRRYLGVSNWPAHFRMRTPWEYFDGPGDKYPYEFDDKILFAYAQAKAAWKRSNSSLEKAAIIRFYRKNKN